MTFKLTDISLNKPDESTKEAVKSAEKRKKSADETLEEAWERILAMKNSDKDTERLLEVKAAMESGEIGREPVPEGKRQGKFSKAEALRLYKVLVDKRRDDILRKMVEDTPDNYWLITDKAKLDEFLSILSEEEIIVFDVETTGPDIWKDYLVGHVITAVEADIHAYIPTKHNVDQPQLKHEYVIEKLRPIYENEAVKKIAHNAKYDIHILANEGIDVKGAVWDTLEAMRMLNENEPTFALKPLVSKYLRIPSLSYGDLFGKKGFNEVELDVALAYAAKDGDVTLKLYEFQRKHLAKMPEVLRYYETVEMPLIKVIVDMERLGYDIDLEYAEQYGKELKSKIDRLHVEIVEGLGDINLNSPTQLKPAIEKAIGRTIENTDAKKTLKPLAREFPIIKTLLEYREVMKLYSTYINALPELINEKTGKLHTVFNQNGAKTGRMSSGGGGVNLQNQPQEARRLFVAPPGYVILGGDWSQQEYRALTYFSQEPRLIENYEQGNDLYATVASEVFDKPIEECGDGSVYRQQAKTIMLAVAYGTGARTLAMQLGKSQEEARKFLKSFDERFPVVAKWIERNREFVQRNGFVWMDKKQRKRRLPDAKNRNSDFWYTSVYTQSTNAIIQGSAAIQTKATMIELDKLCKRKTAEGNGEWRLWCVVHDEALLLVPETITEQDIRDFEDVMLNTYKFGNIPNKCDIEIQRRWGESITAEEYLNGKEVPEL